MTVYPAHFRITKGFTLIELIVAISIMGIVAALAIPGLYGSYQRQQVLNSANQIIATIKITRSKALANDQGVYSKNPPISDCDVNNSYVDSYQVDIGTSNYTVTPALRGGGCKNTPPPTIILNNTINGATVNASSGFPITYKTTSGEMSFNGAGSASIDLLANGFLLTHDIHYYVCINKDKMYAQTTSCS